MRRLLLLCTLLALNTAAAPSPLRTLLLSKIDVRDIPLLLFA